MSSQKSPARRESPAAQRAQQKLGWFGSPKADDAEDVLSEDVNTAVAESEPVPAAKLTAAEASRKLGWNTQPKVSEANKEKADTTAPKEADSGEIAEEAAEEAEQSAAAVELGRQKIGTQTWVCKMDTKSQKIYYFTMEGKKPQWIAPEGWTLQLPPQGATLAEKQAEEDAAAKQKEDRLNTQRFDSPGLNHTGRPLESAAKKAEREAAEAQKAAQEKAAREKAEKAAAAKRPPTQRDSSVPKSRPPTGSPDKIMSHNETPREDRCCGGWFD